MMTGNQQNDWTSPAAVRNQRTEAEYSRARQALMNKKAQELHEVDERYRIIKNAYQLERTSIKEQFALQRLNLKTQIEHLKDKRANLRHALKLDAPTEGMGDLDDFTTRISNLEAQRIGLSRQEIMKLADAEGRFNDRAQLTADDRKAICEHYNKLMEDLRDKYIKQVDDNRAAARQEREDQEGGAEA